MDQAAAMLTTALQLLRRVTRDAFKVATTDFWHLADIQTSVRHEAPTALDRWTIATRRNRETLPDCAHA